MNCKIIFGTAEKFNGEHFSKLTDLSQIIESYNYSVTFKANDYKGFADEIRDSFIENEMTVAAVPGSTFKNGNTVNDVLNSLKINKLDAPQYLTDESGTCFGICVSSGISRIIVLAGIFSNNCEKALNALDAYLSFNSDKAVSSCTINVFGIKADEVTEIISPLLDNKDISVSVLSPAEELCYIHLFATSKSKQNSTDILNSAVNCISSTLGRNVFGTNSDSITEKAVNMLKNSNMKISTAESCTGGLVSKMITDVAGSSSVFEFGIEAYSNRIKIEALGIDERIINSDGAVSAVVAAEMARSVMNIGESEIGIGITGVAGPAASEGKSVGTVYIALTDGTYTWVRHLSMSGSPSREDVRNTSSLIALDLVRRYIELNLEGKLSNISAPNEILITDSQPDCKVTPIVIPAEEKIEPAVKIIGEIPAEPEKIQEQIEPEIIEESEKPEEADKIDFLNKVTSFAEKTKLNFILPISSDNIKTIIGKCAIILAVFVFIISSIFIIANKISASKQNKLIDELRRKWAEQSTSETDDTGKYTSFDFLNTYNKDTVGWLRIAGTDISYPVVCESNKQEGYYENRNFLCKKSKYGTLHTNLGQDSDSEAITKNTVINGNSVDSDKMFGSLKNYRNINYYKSYSRINFKSLYKQANYKIFSIFIINTDAKDDNGYLYDYSKTDFASDSDFISWIKEANARSIITTNVDILPNDKILTLATDSDEFDGAKLVIMAREVRDDESYSLDETNKAVINTKPLYPQKWYDIKGGYSPYGKVTSGMFDGTVSYNHTITETIGGNTSDTQEDIDGTTSITTSRFPDTTGNGHTTSVNTVTGTTTSKVEVSSIPTSSTVTSSKNEVSSKPPVSSQPPVSSENTSSVTSTVTSEPTASSEPTSSSDNP